MDVKDFLEQGTGLAWKELRYLKTPSLPYFIYIDELYTRGADSLNNIVEHNLTLEKYDDLTTIKDKTSEKSIDNFLNSEELKFTKSINWLDEEEMYVTVYEVDTFLEKVRKVGK